MGSGKAAIVKHIPRRFIKEELGQFSCEVQALLTVDRPRLVFDFSGVQEIDRAGAQALLDYLCQVLKANGDIKLACLPPTIGLVFELTGVDRVFEIYSSAFDALESFQQSPQEREPVEEFGSDRNTNGSSHYGFRLQV